MQKHRSYETPGSIPPPSTPVEIARQGQRQRILDAMIECCAEKTYAGTTITDIVAQARISRTTFYKHFKDKRACFDAAVEYCIEALQQVAAKSHSPNDPPADAARQAASGVIGSLAARPGLAQLLTGDAIAVNPMVIEHYRKATIPALEALWRRDGSNPEPHADPRLVFGQAQVLILNQIATGKADQLPELLPEIVYLVVRPYGGHEEALEQSRRAKKTDTDDGAKQ